MARLRTWHILAGLALAASCAATRLPWIGLFCGVVLLAYAPGRIALRLLRLDAGLDAAARLALSVALSLALAPFFLNLCWHATNQAPWLAAAVFVLLAAATLVAARTDARLRQARSGDPANAAPMATFTLFATRRTALLFAILAGFAAAAIAGPYWPDAPFGAPLPSLIHDYIKHHAVLLSLEQRPLPLGGPFFAAAADAPTYYYHFFYLIPATLRAWSPELCIAGAFALAAALAGVSTCAMFYLLARRLWGGDAPALLTLALAAVSGGLDIVPVLAGGKLLITLDAWADGLVRVHPLLTQMTWSPQNVSGLHGLLVAAWLLSVRGWGRAWLMAGPILLANLIGSSVWIAFAAAPAVGLLALRRLRTRTAPPLRLLGAGLASGAAALVLAAPSLLGYWIMSQRLGKGLTVAWPHAEHAWLGRLVAPGVFANLLDAPWFLLLEFGPLLILPVLAARTAWARLASDEGGRLLLISGGLALASFFCLRSHFTYNDFGQKIIMVAMAAAALAAGAAAATAPAGRPPGRVVARRFIVAGVLGLGLLQGVYQASLAVLRRYFPSEGPLAPLVHEDTRRARQERGLLRYLRRELPADAVVQGDPGELRLELCQISNRLIGVTVLERDTMVFQPADTALHELALAEVSAALGQTVEARVAAQTLARWRITHVVLGQVERQTWQGLEKFEDRGAFEPVYSGPDGAVYRVRRPSDVGSTP